MVLASLSMQILNHYCTQWPQAASFRSGKNRAPFMNISTLKRFKLPPDTDLSIFRPGQILNILKQKILIQMQFVLKIESSCRQKAGFHRHRHGLLEAQTMTFFSKKRKGKHLFDGFSPIHTKETLPFPPNEWKLFRHRK